MKSTSASLWILAFAIPFTAILQHRGGGNIKGLIQLRGHDGAGLHRLSARRPPANSPKQGESAGHEVDQGSLPFTGRLPGV
jgi:hypothetical protein